LKYGVYFRMIPLQYKNPVMETGILNVHDDEHFSSISSPLYDQVLFIIAGTSGMCCRAKKHDWNVRTGYFWPCVLY
jgi:hypothetical protein